MIRFAELAQEIAALEFALVNSGAMNPLLQAKIDRLKALEQRVIAYSGTTTTKAEKRTGVTLRKAAITW